MPEYKWESNVLYPIGLFLRTNSKLESLKFLHHAGLDPASIIHMVLILVQFLFKNQSKLFIYLTLLLFIYLTNWQLDDKKFKLELQFCTVLSNNHQPITSSQHPVLLGIIIANLLIKLIGKPTGLKRKKISRHFGVGRIFRNVLMSQVTKSFSH